MKYVFFGLLIGSLVVMLLGSCKSRITGFGVEGVIVPGFEVLKMSEVEEIQGGSGLEFLPSGKLKPGEGEQRLCNTAIYPYIFTIKENEGGDKYYYKMRIGVDKPWANEVVYFATAGHGKLGDVSAYIDVHGDGSYYHEIGELYNIYTGDNSERLAYSGYKIRDGLKVVYRVGDCEKDFIIEAIH